MQGGRTRVFALLGDPVAHSLSPAMHNAAFRVLGLDAVYVPMPCASAHVPVLMAALAEAGGGGNVTVPHKQVAATALTRPSERVTALGACNTFWWDGTALAGESTDVEGVQAALRRLDVEAQTWLVIGTGGSARAVVEAARLAGARLAVSSRDPGRAAALLALAGTRGVEAATADEATLVVNATPLGLKTGDPLPCRPEATPHAVAALDLVYRRGETAWVRQQRAAGRRAADGREVLLAQGAAALTRWFPKQTPPLDVMRAALHAALD
jgi:shikimate dehydrogenase